MLAGSPGTRDDASGGGCVRCAAISSPGIPPWNGGRPVSIANITHPIA